MGFEQETHSNFHCQPARVVGVGTVATPVHRRDRALILPVLLSPPQIPAGLTGFLRIPEDSSGLLYHFGDFELVETNTDKSQESSGLGQNSCSTRVYYIFSQRSCDSI